MSISRALEKDEAFVLTKKRMLKQDSLVVLFTKQTGKIAVIAKGIQKITSRRISALQTGNLVLVSYLKRGDASAYLVDISLISHFSELKKDQEKIQNMYTLFYMLNALLPERQKEDAVYNLCKKTMIQLGKSGVNTCSLTHTICELFNFLGYGEVKTLDECRVKYEEITGKQLPYSII